MQIQPLFPILIIPFLKSSYRYLKKETNVNNK